MVDGVDLTLPAGRTLALVGESGCGKTVTALALMGLLPRRTGRVATGSIRFDGQELVDLPPGALRAVRGRDMAMIFQEPGHEPEPRVHRGGPDRGDGPGAPGGAAAGGHARRGRGAARRVGIPDPAARARSYPHELSGGMRQRVMIAMALVCSPRVLIADEPTTALDVTIQAQVLDLLASLRDELGMAILFVTHDLGVVAEIADRVAVMYAGQIVEQATVDELFAPPEAPLHRGPDPGPAAVGHAGRAPRHHPRPGPGPRRLARRLPLRRPLRPCRGPLSLRSPSSSGRRRPLRAGRRAAPGGDDMTAEPLLEVRGLAKHFPVRSGVLRRVVGQVRAVDGVDLEVGRGETLGLVGECGSGKSTTARLVTRLIEPTHGEVVFGGRIWPPCPAPSSGRPGARCRWSSRTRTRRSTPA